MEVGGLGALISCDDYYNSILCTDWSRVYKTLSCVETSLVPRPHLVRISRGKTHNTESDPRWGWIWVWDQDYDFSNLLSFGHLPP